MITKSQPDHTTSARYTTQRGALQIKTKNKRWRCRPYPRFRTSADCNGADELSRHCRAPSRRRRPGGGRAARAFRSSARKLRAASALLVVRPSDEMRERKTSTATTSRSTPVISDLFSATSFVLIGISGDKDRRRCCCIPPRGFDALERCTPRRRGLWRHFIRFGVILITGLRREGWKYGRRPQLADDQARAAQHINLDAL